MLTIKALRGLFHAAAGMLRTRLRARAERNRARRGLQGLNNHVLRDVGLLRDRFTGTLLSDSSGRILEEAARDAAGPAAELRVHGIALREGRIERRHARRRIAERRTAQRRPASQQGPQENKPLENKPQESKPQDGTGYEPAAASPDRRAFDRRISDSGVLDCRRLFA